jgi:hypothetical protein
MVTAVSAGFGTLAYALPFEEAEIFGKALGFLSLMALIWTIWDNESRKRIRDQELDEQRPRRDEE